MRTCIVSNILCVPLLLGFAQAAQSWSVDQSAGQPWVFSSEDSGSAP